MADLLKNMYNHDSLQDMAVKIRSVYPPFPVNEFLESIMDETWPASALKARVRKIALSLGEYLPADYGEALAILDQVAARCTNGFFGVVFPDFVEVYGQDEINWDLSINALERYTPYSSSEFAVRPFIIRYEERMMEQMYAWSRHENEHVRRLASEGCRPQLPWGQALTKFKKDPAPILPILQQLKADPSLYVRKSVANNINDISKTHPEFVVKLSKDWYGVNESTDWILKHGCRTLLKKGNRDVLALFGYLDADCIDIRNFTLEDLSISLGEDLVFSFSISSAEAAKVRLEYGIDYVKASGKRNRKIFQISDTSLKKDEEKFYKKKHSFADLSTRKHYAGIHSIALIVNGEQRHKEDFELLI
ncbi:DNA alkylation repair protein [Anaerostipes sp.]|uniref:DNA alkylation repair protein n=1 Tax=Anaerostipes sp. TaxID=1872530 RepID=UPI0025C69798|nr:DNA alkylation repair protein [Anaerostipes sp.]MBS7009576.1 DNA alkylation repair protein [Anaerostipes sp.]